MPRGPPPDRMGRRGPPPPPSFGAEPPRGRPGRSPPRRKVDRNGEYRQRDFIEPPRRDHMSPPRRRSRSPIGKPRERMRPITPPPPGRSISPRRSRKIPSGASKMARSKSPKAMMDKNYPMSSKFDRMPVADNLLGEKKNSFGSGVMDRSMFRGPEAYTSYDPEEIKKIRIFIRRRLTSTEEEPMPVSHMAQSEMGFSHRNERDEYREPPKMKRLEEHFGPPMKDSHRGKDAQWNDRRPEPLNMRDGPPPYDMPPRERYRSPPPHERKHDDRMPPRGYDRKPTRDDYRGPDGPYPPHRLQHDNGRPEFDQRRLSPLPFRDDRIDARQRLTEKRMPPGRLKHDGPYPPLERERRVSPSFVDPYRRSPVDRYPKGPRGRSMSPPRRSGPPPMERGLDMDRRRDGPPREERFRSPPRSREPMGNPHDMMPRRGRGGGGGRGGGPGFRGGPPPSMGSPPQRRGYPPSRGGFGNQSRRPFGRK